MKYYDIKTVLFEILLKAILNKEKYTFVDGHPVDTRSKRYSGWRRLYKKNKLKCICCGTEAYAFKLVKCVSHGYLHKETGKIKHYFVLVDRNNKEMTIDHFIPISFLRKKKLKNKPENFVPMCSDCNTFKDNLIPLNWKFIYSKMK